MIRTAISVFGGYKVAVGLTPADIVTLREDGTLTFDLAELGIGIGATQSTVAIRRESIRWHRTLKSNAQLSMAAKGFRYLLVVSDERLDRIGTGSFGFRIEPQTNARERIEFVFFGAVDDRDRDGALRAFIAAGIISSNAKVNNVQVYRDVK